MIRLILIIIACLLFPLSYGICDYFYYSDYVKWDFLRHDLYTLNILLASSVLLFKSIEIYEKWIYLFSSILIFGMLIPSLVDKVIFNDREFHWVDLLFILISLKNNIKRFFPIFYIKLKDF